MTTDHAEFIARHHRTSPQDQMPSPHKGGPGAFTIITSIILVCAYLGICISVAVFLHLPIKAVIAAAGGFVVATLLALFIQNVFHLKSAKEKERELLSEVLEGSRGARLITDDSDRTVYSNQRFDALCADVGKPSFNSLTKIFSENDEALAHFRNLADQAQRGLTDSIEIYSSYGGQEKWYQVTAQPVSGWGGYIHWRVDDITEKREKEREILEEREKLIDFTDNAPVGFFSVDENGRFVFVNATLARWLGEDIHTLLSEGKLHTYFAEPPQDARPFDAIPSGGAKQSGEVIMKGPGGRTFTASISQAVVHESWGGVRTRGVVHDLTAERAMRMALQASEDKFQRFFEEAPLGIALLRADGCLEECNQALADLLGMEVEQMQGQPIAPMCDELDRDQVIIALERIAAGQEMKAPLEITLHGKKGSVMVSLYARRLASGENIVLHFIDLSEQKSLEQQFVQSQKMQAIGQLAGGVAHDFNNLLTAMIGFCDLLLLRHKPGDPSFSDIMQIKQNSNRAANLVRQLLAFSRQQTLRPKVQDFTDILTEISHLLRRLIGANIELEVVHGADLGLVRVDVGQMEQVLINLAVNARDAMDGGGKLTITTHALHTDKPLERGGDEMPPGEWVVIEVSDTGCGIADDNLGRIFEPFFTTKEVGQGTGLGLATVYGIIRQTGGYLHVASEENVGTTFAIYLPRLSENEVEEDEKQEEPEDAGTHDLTGTARILLVEDEDAVRTFSSRALSNKGYEVHEAESGEAALNVIKELASKQIDLLITDVIMPNMDGPTLAQRLRQVSPELKIIFISGYTEEKLKEHMGENIWFLPKPFTLKQLAAKVKEALEE
jgi:two-component system cell cycle sensor histidine kinase/response regulator CckA